MAHTMDSQEAIHVSSENVDDASKREIEKDVNSFGPRMERHPKPVIRPRDVVTWAFRPFELAPRTRSAEDRLHYRKPEDLPSTSRFRLRRRALRLRLRRKLIAILWWKRFVYSGLILAGLVLVVFWAKLAIVYNVPTFLRVGVLGQAQAYVVWKSWWFGPTSFNLADYTGLDPLNPLQSLVLQLSRYQDVVTNAQEVIYIFTKRTF